MSILHRYFDVGCGVDLSYGFLELTMLVSLHSYKLKMYVNILLAITTTFFYKIVKAYLLIWPLKYYFSQQLAEEGTTRQEVGREEFLDRVWKYKEEQGGHITRQLRCLG